MIEFVRLIMRLVDLLIIATDRTKVNDVNDPVIDFKSR